MSKKPVPTDAHADFSWPPPDEELAQWFDSASSHEEFAQGGVKSAAETSVLDEPVDSAVAEHEAALDGTNGGDWAGQIAHLQALLEALTEKVEWRVTNINRR